MIRHCLANQCDCASLADCQYPSDALTPDQLTDRELGRHIAWLNTLSPDALITLAAMHFKLAAQKSKKASSVLAVDPSVALSKNAPDLSALPSVRREKE